MPLDGVTLNSVVQELATSVVGGRVDKVQQPEPDEIIISVRNAGQNYKILLTSNANSPRVHLTEKSKANPITAPNFCMVLRKHLGGGRIKAINQPAFERIVEIYVESPNDMGDLQTKCLLIEIMGKHSNIILLDSTKKIMDSIRHITHQRSSVREVLPGVQYSSPPSNGKISPVPFDKDYFDGLFAQNKPVQNLLYQSYNGISPILASEISIQAGIAPETYTETINETQKNQLAATITNLYNNVATGNFNYTIYTLPANKRDFHATALSIYAQQPQTTHQRASQMLEEYYTSEDKRMRITQKTAALKKSVQNQLDRCNRKQHQLTTELQQTAAKEQQRLYGELLTAYMHTVPHGADSVVVANFYSEDNSTIKIPLKTNLSPAENAQAYFNRYNKAKRANIALQEQIAANTANINYLESVLTAIANIEFDPIAQRLEEADIQQIRTELAEQGFIKKAPQSKKAKQTPAAQPLKYTTPNGHTIYIGKNNTQNDEVTFKIAAPTDIWLHIKDLPGSHVVIKLAKNLEEPLEEDLTLAASLAAYHSKAKNETTAAVDYCPRKNVRKPKGAKPGFVIYNSYNTVYVKPQNLPAG